MPGANEKGALGGAAQGASAGAAAGPWGAAVGAVVGGIAGLFGAKKAKKQPAPVIVGLNHPEISQAQYASDPVYKEAVDSVNNWFVHSSGSGGITDQSVGVAAAIQDSYNTLVAQGWGQPIKSKITLDAMESPGGASSSSLDFAKYTWWIVGAIIVVFYFVLKRK